jgi:hypothetical protein
MRGRSVELEASGRRAQTRREGLAVQRDEPKLAGDPQQPPRQDRRPGALAGAAERRLEILPVPQGPVDRSERITERMKVDVNMLCEV